MRTLLLAASIAIALPMTAASQGVTVSRPVDPSKPRDGFGFHLEMKLVASGDNVISRGYPQVVKVDDGTPAAKAGMKVGDVILAIDGRDLVEEVARIKPTVGSRNVFRIRRGSETFEMPLVAVRLYTPPDSTQGS